METKYKIRDEIMPYNELVFEIEMYFSLKCHKDEDDAVSKNLPYECTCPDLRMWSKEKVLTWFKNRGILVEEV